MKKRCSHCRRLKPGTAFSVDKGREDGKCPQCRACRKEASRKSYTVNRDRRIAECKQYRLKNPHIKRDYDLTRLYGISLNTYERLLKKQNGVCAICKHICTTGKNLSVDHNHSTGKVRGLLCRRCNLVLGSIEEVKETYLSTMLEYLK